MPLLLVTQRYFALRGPSHSGCAGLSAWFVWMTVATAAGIVLILPSEGIERSALSFLAVVTLFLVYAPLLLNEDTRQPLDPKLCEFREEISGLSMRTVIVLAALICLQTYVFGFTTGTFTITLSLVVTKAFSWYLAAKAVGNCQSS